MGRNVTEFNHLLLTVSEFRGSTNTMDVDELSSINREVDDIIQLPPEPNPPPAHMSVDLERVQFIVLQSLVQPLNCIAIKCYSGILHLSM